MEVVGPTTGRILHARSTVGSARWRPRHSEEDPMTAALARLRADVSRDHVLLAIEQYDRLGPDRFFSQHGFGPSRSYELIWNERRYPHKAILGTAYELATGQRLASGDFEGGKSGAVAVLTQLGFTVKQISVS
jgi:hypothetical protein